MKQEPKEKNTLLAVSKKAREGNETVSQRKKNNEQGEAVRRGNDCYSNSSFLIPGGLDVIGPARLPLDLTR